MIWGAVGLYALAALVLAWRARRRLAGGDEFWTAGRALGPASVGLSISAGFMSVSWSCVYATQLYYWYGLGALWLITLPWLVTLTGIWLLAGRYRALPAFSQPEMIRRRFGSAPAVVVAVALAFVFLVWAGAEIYVAARLLSPPLEVAADTLAVGIAALVGLYAVTGGFGAVVATDRMQFLLVALYVLVVAVLAWQAGGEGGARWPEPDAAALRSEGPWTDVFSPGAGLIIVTLLAYLPGWLFETDLWLRVQAARDAATARRGVLLAGLNACLFVGLFPALIGIIALAVYAPAGGVAPGVVGVDGDGIFAAFVRDFAPAWLAALVALGLVAAAMSTIDTCCNVVALSLGYDLLGVHRRTRGLAWSRAVTLVAVLGALGVALGLESLWHAFYLSGGILTCSVALPVAAVHWPRARARAVLVSSVAGLLATVLAYAAGTRGLLDPWMPAWLVRSEVGFIVAGLVAAGAGFLLFSLVPRRPGAAHVRF